MSRRRRGLVGVVGIVSWVVCAEMALAQTSATQADVRRTGSSPHFKPAFVVREADLQKPTTIIAYGDMRFTASGALPEANVAARRALVARVAQERPDAVLLNGDLPMRGGDPGDYEIYRSETQAWRDAHLRIFPVLGNHEFAGCGIRQCLQNWWETFPQLKNRRWYSVALGTKVFVIGLDSNDSLLPGSPQHRWLETQIATLPKSFRFVLITLHHEPVGDIQAGADDNPRPNEMALADLLKSKALQSNARFVVIAGHIHNYERFEQDGVAYLVSGGGGAPQQTIERNPTDLYKGDSFPNFHYVKFEIRGSVLSATMYRLADSTGQVYEARDSFAVEAKPESVPKAHKPD